MLARRQLTRPAARMRRSRREQAGDGLLWLFDLDNTLHDTSHAIFPKIDAGMTRAVSEMLDVDVDAANEYRTRYWKRYGATVIGMVRHHGADPHRFLHRSHDFDVKPLVRAEKGLANKLKRLPGRKVLLTNAPLHYARAVLRHLGILQQFDALWGIDQMRLHGEFRPKPSAALLRYVLAHEGVPARRAVLVEDTLDNLRGARRAGLRTVHVYHPGTPFARAHRHRPGYVDLRVNCVTDLLLRRRPLRG
ncbi:pyrimidine 5'-nucleotidase [Bordetella holmesii]|uniref:Pyrimidine 5'-nucleotidase n=2 Tax=Bordetella holmesii TaxID=35814 RepID=A0A158M6N7_9BORD|nr:pyrimidine 5'-nucleotidase [Bordetella holmesii]AHV93008.1 HAD hydrolase, IA, variant 3 family protein [Bordetella holmesii ATCC 51541]AIT26471.1 HAD hydrolase, IA, variant 3 family protein [Bordetella holmesii 44057]EWM42120.1 HAD hydrolase, IA, variant 3 family protein [Bordetella holmesii 41130]EWM47045.1 HAD hydrolase, IA, variant 3 family protein [Bordetella holmesii 35009]EWM51213.1 HAD hydrolase, IA, variant 3 family protein [Bordetella holmesii 70147]